MGFLDHNFYGSPKLTLPEALRPLLSSNFASVQQKMNSLLLWGNPHTGVLSLVKMKDLTKTFVLSLLEKGS